MAKTKEIQSRIKSVKSTKKITKAMEMVAASKMKKTIDSVLKTRTYSNLGWVTVVNLAKSLNNRHEKHPLLTTRQTIKKELIILISSNRGLCGSLNSAIINKAHESIKKYSEPNNIQTDFIIIGKKGGVIHKYKYKILAEFEKKDVTTTILDVRPVAQLIIKEFACETYDKVMLAYTDFISPMEQKPRIKQLIPVETSSEDHFLGATGKSELIKTDLEYIKTKEDKYLHDQYGTYEYTFEPSESEVLSQLIPRLIETQIYQAILESNASEHSARMNAMHNATLSANDLIEELTLYYNKARQSGITSELSEISAGAEALN